MHPPQVLDRREHHLLGTSTKSSIVHTDPHDQPPNVSFSRPTGTLISYLTPASTVVSHARASLVARAPSVPSCDGVMHAVVSLRASRCTAGPTVLLRQQDWGLGRRTPKAIRSPKCSTRATLQHRWSTKQPCSTAISRGPPHDARLGLSRKINVDATPHRLQTPVTP